jgi:methyltransferase (TIGR00027 family)
MREGHASLTARRVAAHRLSFPRLASPYGRPEVDRQLQTDVAAGVELEPTPIARYLRARTAFFDRVVVGALDAGTRQVVVVGAGYDGRSLRYAKPGVRWFELDHPDTQADKRARLERLGIATAEIGFAAADFAVDDAAEALARAGHDPGQASLFACEGVAAYLPIDALAALLRALRGRAAPASTLAITLALRSDSPAGTPAPLALRAAAAGMGEPLLSELARGELTAFLLDGGWAVRRATDPAGVELERSERASAFVLAAAAEG